VKLRQLFEAHHKADAAFCFGRFNPPHQGHMEVWNAVKHAGRHWFIGTNPGTIGPNDPLPYDLKTAWMTAIDPQIKGHILGEQSVVTLAAKIYQQVGDGATIAYVTDSQDWAWAGKLLHQYNGKESNHGYFNFAKIIHVESPRVSSATALRTAARAGDMNAFYQAAGTDPNLAVNGQHYYDTVVAAVGQHPEKVKKVKKEKPVAEPVVQERNLIKYANKVLREMRAKDFVQEGKVTDRHPDHDAASQGVSRTRDVGGYDRIYHMNRLMMAMAMADGKSTKGVDSPQETWAEKYNTHHPYTKEEDNMVRAAMNTIPTDGKHISKFGKSVEPHDTHKVSPVAQRKTNKYGV